MKVYFSELAEKKLIDLNNYLLVNWNEKVKNDFKTKLKKRINQIIAQPKSCPESLEFKGLFKCVVSKQNTFYYRINEKKQEIEIITFFDTRQNPNELIK